MADPDYKALCAELVVIEDAMSGGSVQLSSQGQALDGYAGLAAFRYIAAKARIALAQPEPQGPTDKELLELMPETMRDEFSYAARTCSDAMGGRVKPGIFRVALNTAALEYAQAVLQRYGRSAIEPVPIAKRLPRPEDCDAEGKCWWWAYYDEEWVLDAPPRHMPALTHWLPHHALPVPQQEAE